MPEKKMSDSVAAVVMILVLGPEQDNRAETTTYTPATQPPRLDTSGSIISGLKEASVCVPDYPGAKPANSKAERASP